MAPANLRIPTIATPHFLIVLLYFTSEICGDGTSMWKVKAHCDSSTLILLEDVESSCFGGSGFSQTTDRLGKGTI
jgi:hypothetical protein